MLAEPKPLAAAEPYDVFVLSVGSQHYLQAEEPALRGYPEAIGAVRSARRVGRVFADRGADRTEVLVSSREQPVGIFDVMSAIDRTAEAARTSGSRRPLIVVYVASHGVSEGFGWSYFGIPGNLLIEQAEAPDFELLSKKTLYAAELVDRLSKAGIPYLVLLDTCYEGSDRLPLPPVLSEAAASSIMDVADILRHMNSFRQPDPVLFAAAPGTVVATQPDPKAPTVASLAPLARRITLLNDVTAGTAVTLGEFVARLVDPALDELTAPAVTQVEHDTERMARQLLARREAPGSDIEESYGTAVTADVCCVALNEQAEGSSSGHTLTFDVELEIDGEPGDWVSDGQDINLSRQATEVVLYGLGSLSAALEGQEGEWRVDLIMPGDTAFVPGLYAGAEQAWFQAEDQPGLDVAGPGRSCGGVEGEFTVLAAVYDPEGHLHELDAVFTQRCESSPSALKGRIRLKRDA